MISNELHTILRTVNFDQRYRVLFEKHNHKNLFKNADLKEVCKHLQILGYNSSVNKTEKFIRVQTDHASVTVNIALTAGVVEIILNLKQGREIEGGPLGYLYSQLSGEERNLKPRFSSYQELEEILVECFSLVEEIKNEWINVKVK